MITIVTDWLARLFAWARGETPADDSKAAGESCRSFRAVAIEPVGESCHAAQDWHSARFLTTQAPRLPLAGCPTPDACRCRYRKFDDRREGTDRRAGFAPIEHAERRRRIDRRAHEVEF